MICVSFVGFAAARPTRDRSRSPPRRADRPSVPSIGVENRRHEADLQSRIIFRQAGIVEGGAVGVCARFGAAARWVIRPSSESRPVSIEVARRRRGRTAATGRRRADARLAHEGRRKGEAQRLARRSRRARSRRRAPAGRSACRAATASPLTSQMTGSRGAVVLGGIDHLIADRRRPRRFGSRSQTTGDRRRR